MCEIPHCPERATWMTCDLSALGHQGSAHPTPLRCYVCDTHKVEPQPAYTGMRDGLSYQAAVGPASAAAECEHEWENASIAYARCQRCRAIKLWIDGVVYVPASTGKQP